MAAKPPPPNVRADVRRDWIFASQHESEVLKFVRDHLFERWMKDSSMRVDCTQATDYRLESPQRLDIAVRVRRVESAKGRRDFTIRWQRVNRTKTEAAKIAEGNCDLYVYCWVTEEALEEYMIVDMDKFRRSGLMNRPDGIKANIDHATSFAFWRWESLQDAGVLLEHVKYPGRAVWFATVIKEMERENCKRSDRSD